MFGRALVRQFVHPLALLLPPLQRVFGTAALPGWVLLLLLPFPFIVWGVDEISRWRRRRRRDRGPAPR